jgi:hypothetical protein
VARFFIHTNLVSSAAVLLLLAFLFRRVAGVWVACAVAFALSCSTSFLNYSHSGTPYISALLFSSAALLLLIRSSERPTHRRRNALLAGVSFAIACALWFPFAFTGLGLVAAIYFWLSNDPSWVHDEGRARRRMITSFLTSLIASALVLFAGGAVANGVDKVTELARWIVKSDNAWSQSGTAMRAVTGISRGVWDFGGETVLLKRWLFHDPYNPVRITSVIATLGTKLAIFYLGVAAALYVLWKERRETLFILSAAILPLVLFAIGLFEPSSPERFLPVFAFAYLAFAIVVSNARRHRVPFAIVAILLLSTTLVNLTLNSAFAGGDHSADARRRIEALRNRVQPGALVTVLTLNDDVYRLRLTRPLDRSLTSARFRVVDAVVVANRNTPRWRGIFAEEALGWWARHREVWISERLLAQRPDAHWLWVEGDDRRVRWAELPAAFSQLETDMHMMRGMDGFLRVAQTAANRERLTNWATALRPDNR